MEREMDPVVRTLMDWLHGQTNNAMVIQKKEDDDTDKVRLQLEKVGYRADAKSIDGYTEGSAIVLHGSGAIVTGAAEAPLPDDSYVIPVAGLTVSQATDDGVTIQTARARYSLSVDHSGRR